MTGSYDLSYYGIQAWAFLVNHLWQATLFAGIAFAAAVVLHRAPARVRYTIWMLASLKFILPSALFVSLARLLGFDASAFLLSIAWASGNPLGLLHRQEQIFNVVGTSGAGFGSVHPLLIGASIVWLSGTLVFIAIWMKRQIGFHRKLRECEEVTTGRELETLNKLKAKLGIQKEIKLIRSKEITEPGVWGIWRPVIVFSTKMSSQLTDSELETVFLHELAHILRWDNLFSTLQMMISSLFWFHPVVWWIDRRLLAERERACDDRVIECGGKSRIYAASLVKVLEFGLGFRMAGVSCAGGSDLKKRIDHITSQEKSRKLALIHWMILTGLILTLAMASIAAVNIGECEKSTLQKQLSAHQKESCETYAPGSSCSLEPVTRLFRSATFYLNLTRKAFADRSSF
jgi:bla regulator protein blaR1